MSENPFQNYGTPINPPMPVNSTASQSNRWRFIPLNKLTMLATIGLIFDVVMSLLSVCFGFVGMIMFPSYSDPLEPLSPGLEEAIYFAEIGTSVVTIPVFIFSAVVICMFMYRANTNVRALGATGLQFTPGWCGGYWFIPILCLFRPYQCMKEIYRASSNPESWNEIAAPSMIGFWWTCWLLGNFSSNIESRLLLFGVDLGAGSIVLHCFVVAMFVGAAILLVKILRSITTMQSNYIHAIKTGN